MTTPKDNLNSRLTSDAWGEGRENTLGVSETGFHDPSGEFPKKEHQYGSSISKYGRGNDTFEVSLQGTGRGAGVETPSKPASELPYTNVKETPSGHIIEINDTPGAESMTVRHRTGTGVEIRADGTIVVSSVSNRIEVTAGDQTMVVSGEGKMVYNGNLNLTVAGDYNLNIGGAYNVNVAGDMAMDVFGGARRRVVKRDTEVILGDQDTRVVGHRASLCLLDDTLAVGGSLTMAVASDIEISTNSRLDMSAKAAFSLVAVSGVVTAKDLSVLSATGTIGGEGVHHHGRAFMGPVGADNISAATFYGNLAGKAAEALTADNALRAREAYVAFYATGAGQANQALGTGGSPPVVGTYTPTLVTDPQYQKYHTFQIPASASTIMADNQLVEGILTRSSIGIRNVLVDPAGDLVDQLTKINTDTGKFNRTPTEDEIRETLRDMNPDEAETTQLAAQLVAEGRLSTEWDRLTPPGTRRVAGASPVVHFSRTPIGTQTPATRSKRFTPKE